MPEKPDVYAVQDGSNNAFEETDKRNGKVIAINRMTVSSDGKTMTMDITDKERGTTMQLTADKQ
jgi:uncharacterized membrane-anchored protein